MAFCLMKKARLPPVEEKAPPHLPYHAFEWGEALRSVMMDDSSNYSVNKRSKAVVDAPALSHDEEDDWVVPELLEYLYPCPTGSHTALHNGDLWNGPIRVASIARFSNYFYDFGNLRREIVEQQAEDARQIEGAAPAFLADSKIKSKMLEQGPWDESCEDILSVSALPMPVEISDAESLHPFFSHIEKFNGPNTDWDRITTGVNISKEPAEDTDMIEFPKGVLYADGRMDLCKMVLGPPNIGSLLKSMENDTFIKHFLLGNNIIGPAGARVISDFVRTRNPKIETWYLAGNCIDRASLEILASGWNGSEYITNIWLKRNALGPESAPIIAELILNLPNLRTLDLDQTKLGDAGVARLFDLLASKPNSLRNIYLNGSGISTNACRSIAIYLRSLDWHGGPKLESLYISNNPIGDAGAKELSKGLKVTLSLKRLVMSSCGLKNEGVRALLNALTGKSELIAFDIGQSFATEDLGTRYNYLNDGEGLEADLGAFIAKTPNLQVLEVGVTAMSRGMLFNVAKSIFRSRSLVHYLAETAVPKPRSSDSYERIPQSVWKGQVKSINYHLMQNFKQRFGNYHPGMSFERFRDRTLRFVKNTRDVRFIDSVYRNRDANLARRKLKVLKKRWDEGDTTLEKVMAS